MSVSDERETAVRAVTAGTARVPPRPRRLRPWQVGAASLAALLAVLCVRNGFLFTTRLYEDADMGANSILIEQARHFTLLVGNYSRDHFNHPGPAYMYVQAAGESLFWAFLHLVPTPWNGQLLAAYALNATFLSLVVGMAYGWTRSLRGAAAAFAVMAGFAAAHPAVLSTDWMPYLYVPAYIAFIAASASVAAGFLRHAWIMALAAWFLIHGHACFLFFVPVISLAVLAAVLWPRRRRLRAAARSFFGTQRRVWVPVVAISAVFALPIILNLALHWPGQFGDYLTYTSSSRAGGHSVAQATHDALWYWWPFRSWWAPGGGYAIAAVVTGWLAPARLRRFLIALLAVNAVSSLAFGYYAANGIDVLSEHYVGYFYWSAPVVTLLVIALGVAEALPARWHRHAHQHGQQRSGRAHQRPGHRPRAARRRRRDRRALRRQDDRAAVRPALLARRHRFSRAGVPRGDTGLLGERLDLHADHSVRLHEPSDRERQGLLVHLRRPARQHRPRAAPAGRGDRGTPRFIRLSPRRRSGDGEPALGDRDQGGQRQRAQRGEQPGPQVSPGRAQHDDHG